MLENYFFIAIKNIKNHILFSALNIFGLALGIAISLLTICFVHYEHGYDSHFEHSERTYRLTRHFDSEDMHLAAIAAPFKELLKTRLSSDIDQISMIGMVPDLALSYENIHINADDVLMADSDIFDVFDFGFIQGEAKDSLSGINRMVLTETMAKKFFGEENGLGKQLILHDLYPVEVTGIIQDLPDKTHFRFGAILSLDNLRHAWPTDMVNWDFNNFYTYVRLKPEVKQLELEEKFPALLAELGEDVADDQRLKLQPIEDIHLHSNLTYEMKANGNYQLTYSFLAIAIIILLIACINFMNLSTARASQRAKEVGMRKASGASRRQLIIQFLSESIVLTSIALFLALALVEILMPWFSSFIQKPIDMHVLYQPTSILSLALFTFTVGCISGSYPALYLSSFQPSKVLKGELVKGRGAQQFRKALVILQFSISITLIISTLIILEQTEFARKQDPGYDREHNVVISLGHTRGFDSTNTFYRALRERLIHHPDIISVAAAQQLPTMALRDIWSYVNEHKNIVAENMISLPTLNAGYHFHEHYKIPLIAGRYFSEKHGDGFVRLPTEENPVGSGTAIVSRSAAKALGFTPAEAVDRIIKIPFPPGSTNYRIVGVVEDIQLGSLHEEQKPQVYHLVRDNERFVNVRINANKLEAALAHIDTQWNEIVPHRPISRTFLDENFHALYKREDKQAQIFATFSLLAILIACMGLFGLAAFTTEKRRKEIGIRKAMGASIWDIVSLLTREFNILMLIANVIAWPLAYILASRWLDTFTKHIDLTLWPFLVSGTLAILIAWLTVGANASYCAANKPIKSLRYE